MFYYTSFDTSKNVAVNILTQHTKEVEVLNYDIWKNQFWVEMSYDLVNSS